MNRGMKQGAVLVAIVAGLGTVGAGCLTRPIEHQDPTTKVNFTTVVHNQAVDKLDLLFMIDNSASMGDKQQLLAEAVPDMINRLVSLAGDPPDVALFRLDDGGRRNFLRLPFVTVR